MPPSYEQMQWDILLPLSYGKSTLTTEAEVKGVIKPGGVPPGDPLNGKFWKRKGKPIPDDLLEEYWRINKFLGDKARVDNALAALEAELKTKFDLLAPGEYGKGVASLFNYLSAKRQHRIHLLTEVLSTRELIDPASYKPFSARREASGNAWMPQDHRWSTRRNPTYLGPLPADDFEAVNRAGLHFKDPLVSVTHGEYSHRIQWWLIDYERNRTGTPLTLSRTTSELFQLMANYYAEPEWMTAWADSQDAEVTLVNRLVPSKPTLKNANGKPTKFRRQTDGRLTATMWMCVLDRLPSGNIPLDIVIDPNGPGRTPVYYGGSVSAHDLWPGGLPLLAVLTRLKHLKASGTQATFGNTFTNSADLARRVRRTFGATMSTNDATANTYAKAILDDLGYLRGLETFLDNHEPPTKKPKTGAAVNWSGAAQKLMVYLLEKFWEGYYKQLAAGTKSFQEIISALTKSQQRWLYDLSRKGVLEPGVYPPGWTQLKKTATLP